MKNLKLTPEIELACLEKRAAWVETARPNQLPPQGIVWDNWFLMAGRGFGKTKTVSEDAWWDAFENPGGRTCIIAPTAADVRDTCFEGVSGLLNCAPECFVQDYKSSLNELTFKNGAIIKGFSAEKPDRLRGPQHRRAYCDEIAAWEYGEETWDMMRFGLRLGDHPQIIIASTPKPTDLVRKLYEDPMTYVTHGTTFENRSHLSSKFFDAIRVYEGTTIGRQELYGELIDLEEMGVYRRSWFKLWPHKKPLPAFQFILDSYDTAFTDKTTNDPTGKLTLGLFKMEDDPRMMVMLIDAWTDHLQYPDLKKKIKEEANYLYGANDKKIDLILIENKGSGMDIINDLRFATNLPLFPYNPLRADKASRAHAVSYIPCNGHFWVPESEVNRKKPRDWVEPVLHQLCAFPNTSHDEYVDCLSQALALIRDQGWFITKNAEDEGYVDREDRPRTSGRPVRNPYMV